MKTSETFATQTENFRKIMVHFMIICTDKGDLKQCVPFSDNRVGGQFFAIFADAFYGPPHRYFAALRSCMLFVLNAEKQLALGSVILQNK